MFMFMFMNIFSINKKAATHKYKQIIISIEDAIVAGTLEKSDKLPWLNL